MVLLHFQDQHANVHRDHVIRELKKHLPKYEKGANFYPDPLEPKTADALARALWLADRIERDDMERHANPSTGICNLVENLTQLGCI